MRAVIEQIETCELKATEWRVAMRLLHQADRQGKVVLSREACVALCQVHVWGAAARILCRLAGQGLIGWYSDRQGVYVYFTGWRSAAFATGEDEAQEAAGYPHAGGRERMAGSAPVQVSPANLAPQGGVPGGMGDFPLLLQAMSEMTRQNGALLGVLADLTRQIGALVCALAQGDAPLSPPSAAETRPNGASDEVFARWRAEVARETRQNGALCSALAGTGAVTEGSLPHTYASARVGADGQSVCLSDPNLADPQTDRQTGLATSVGLHEETRLAPNGAGVEAQADQGAERSRTLPLVEPGIEPELALGLLTSREVGLPLRDAEAVAYAHPFWRIRDCVFYFLNQRVAKRFRSPRIMLTWLAHWEQWVVPATDEADAETALYQRYLLPAERQVKAEEAARVEEMAEQEGEAWEEGGGREQGARSREQGAGGREQEIEGRRQRTEDAVEPAGVDPVVAACGAVWQTVLSDLALQMPAAAYNTWVRDTWLSGVEHGPAEEGGLTEEGPELWVIGVANAYAVDWLRSRLHGKIERAIRVLVGRAVCVQFAVLPRPALAQALCAR